MSTAECSSLRSDRTTSSVFTHIGSIGRSSQEVCAKGDKKSKKHRRREKDEEKLRKDKAEVYANFREVIVAVYLNASSRELFLGATFATRERACGYRNSKK